MPHVAVIRDFFLTFTPHLGACYTVYVNTRLT